MAHTIKIKYFSEKDLQIKKVLASGQARSTNGIQKSLILFVQADKVGCHKVRFQVLVDGNPVEEANSLIGGVDFYNHY